MLFVLTPQAPAPSYFDPEQAYAEYRRREYVAALQQRHQRAQFERELALEEQRHRQALASIAQQEAARRQRQASLNFAARHPRQQQQQADHPGCGARRGFCAQPTPEEILRRRQARQAEEERLSREFHQHILSQIFGVPSDEQAASSEPKEQEPSAPVASTSAKGKESTVKRPFNAPEPEPHWSAAPERARALAELTSVTRTFASLKNTFVFPSGPLERLPGSDVPRLAYNPTNASIHAYEHALAELLTKLDGIESHGFKGVREARKQLVVKIEKVLEELEKQVAERLAEGASPATVSAAIPESPTVAHTEEKEVQDVVTEDSTQVDVNQDSSNVGGYDVEPEVEAAPETVMQDSAEVISSEAALLVPLTPEELATVPTPSDEPPTHLAEVSPESQSEEEAREPTTINSAVLPASSSDDESEIEDAVHVDIEVSSDEEDIVEAKHDADDANDSDAAFEML